jgi:hypothetical protein
MLHLRCADGVFRRSIKEKIHPTRWDFQTQRPVIWDKKDKLQAAQLIKVNKIFEGFTDLKLSATLSGEPLTKQRAEETLNRLLGVPEKTAVSFEEGSQVILEEMRSGALLTPKGKRYAEWSIKQHNLTRNNLLKFQKAKRVSIEFKDVTILTYYKFIEYCNEQNWALNSVGTYIKNWRQFLMRGHEKGWHKNQIHEHKDFKILSEETYDIYLTQQELKKIIKAKHSGERQIARDWFLIGCYTALRISDLKVLDERKVFGDFLVLTTEKTDERVEIPVHPTVKSIIQRYKGFPPAMSDVDINREIKEVAKQAGIKEKVLYSVTEGGVRKDYWLEKWQMVSLHTARRTMITNARLMQMPDSVVMKLAGIRSIKTLLRYDKLSQSQAAHIAAAHSFFKG